MVGPSTSLSKSKEKQPIVIYDESDDEPSGLRELLTELEEYTSIPVLGLV